MSRLLTILFIAFWSSKSQAATIDMPDGGALLRQIPLLVQPIEETSGSGLQLEQADKVRTPLPKSDPIYVQRIEIIGNTLFATKTLTALVARAEGQSLTLPQLGDFADIITTYYHSRGYLLSRAVIPAQTIISGQVRIEIIEARYGIIELKNSSKVSSAVLKKTLSNLRSGRDINQAELDYVLLLLTDMPAVKVDAKLQAGLRPGTSDLHVVAEPGKAILASVAQDNAGDSYTGRARLIGTMTINNPLSHGDSLSAAGMSSGEGLNYAQLSYDTVMDGRGTRMGAAYSALGYSLGGPISSLQAHGTAREARLWMSRPLFRSKDINLYGNLQYENQKLRDHIDVARIRTDRGLQNWIFTFNGDMRDQLLSDSLNSWGIAATIGRVSFDDAAAQVANATMANTQGGFLKWTVKVDHLQGLNPTISLYLRLAAQWASTNLDSAQKFSPGGLSGVRAYGAGTVSGDVGYLFNAEFRRNLGSALQGQLQAIAFVDNAHVTVNSRIWTAGTNSASLSGAGVGVNWAGSTGWNMRATIANPIGSSSGLPNTARSLRAWLEVRKSW